MAQAARLRGWHRYPLLHGAHWPLHNLLARDVRVWMESVLQIKRSIDMIRGKDDRVDAQRIARYVLLHRQEAKCVNLSGVTLERLKDLQANRSRLLKALQSIKVTVKELIAVDPVSGKTLKQVNKKAIKGLEKSMEQVYPPDQVHLSGLSCMG